MASEFIHTLVKFMEQLPEAAKYKSAFLWWVSHRSSSPINSSKIKDLERFSARHEHLKFKGCDLVYLEINMVAVLVLFLRRRRIRTKKKMVGLRLRFLRVSPNASEELKNILPKKWITAADLKQL